ncbi:MAG: hypothetical protein V5B34_16235 [Accumulibacter sp.]|jgi:hypothetical protein
MGQGYHLSCCPKFRGPLSHPPASINEAADAIRKLTGLSRSPTQVRLSLREKCGMKRLKTGTLPAKADPEVQEEFKKTT